MDYGGVEKRRTKKDLKKKRLIRVYKRGGQYRGMDVTESREGIEKKGKNKGKKKGTNGGK